MDQWFDSCLVAVRERMNRTWICVELAPRQTRAQTSVKAYASEERAREAIQENYNTDDIICVEMDDITEEIQRRMELKERAESLECHNI